MTPIELAGFQGTYIYDASPVAPLLNPGQAPLYIIIMFKPYITRQAYRAVNTAVRSSTRSTFVPLRPFAFTGSRFKSDNSNNRDDGKGSSKDPVEAATTRAPEGASGKQEGQFARTDKEIVIPYPEDEYQPQQYTVQGRGGIHFKRTLAQFSLEDKVTVVTGGARGLGLVMAQALVASGSDVAIVDLNSMLFCHFRLMV